MSLFRPHGFTLMELAIVLVVIGLIVGAVVVGRDLVRAATIRATVRQVEQYNVAANTFRTRYGCLPGDCPDASGFGFDAASAGNGDGIVGFPQRACAFGDPCEVSSRHEHVDFWYSLSAAHFIAQSISPSSAFTTLNDTVVGVATPATPLQIAYNEGNAAVPATGGWVVHGPATVLSPGSEAMLTSGHTLALGNSLAVPYFNIRIGYRPGDLFAIDAKLDDGLPFRGNVRAVESTGTSTLMYYAVAIQGPAGEDSPYCIAVDSAAAYYNTAYAGAAAGGSCGIVIKAGF